jgi:hypothetical protein
VGGAQADWTVTDTAANQPGQLWFTSASFGVGSTTMSGGNDSLALGDRGGKIHFRPRRIQLE